MASTEQKKPPVESGDIVAGNSSDKTAEPSKPDKTEKKMAFVVTLANANVPPQNIEVRADGDLVDLREAIGRGNCYLIYEKKALYEDVRLSVIFAGAAEPIKVACSLRLGGAPQISDYIQKVSVKTSMGAVVFSRNWANGRTHRAFAEVCNDVKVPLPFCETTSYLGCEPKKTDQTTVSSAHYLLQFKFRAFVDTYRLDCKSFNNWNVHLVEAANPSGGKIIDVNFSAGWPNYDSTVPQDVTVTLRPRETLKRNTYYLLCMHSTRFWPKPQKDTAKTLLTKVMNPYYPPGVADTSDGFSTSWRGSMGGEIIYCFRFV